MVRFYYGNGHYGYAPEKDDILERGQSYLCSSCGKKTNSKVLEIRAVEYDLITLKHKCIECGCVMTRNFDLPKGESAYEFVSNSNKKKNSWW